MVKVVYNLSKRDVITVEPDGKTSIEMSLNVFCSIDGDLADVAAQAQEQPGVAIIVPNTARLPRPRNAVVYAVQQ